MKKRNAVWVLEKKEYGVYEPYLVITTDRGVEMTLEDFVDYSIPDYDYRIRKYIASEDTK